MSILAYGLVALAIMSSIGYGVSRVKAWGADEVRAEWAAANLKAKAAAEAKDEENRKEKEKADDQNAKAKRELAGLYDAYRSLRDQPARRFVPEAPAGSASAARACYDPVALDSALRTLDKGVAGLLQEGDSAITDLNTARKWAKP